MSDTLEGLNRKIERAGELGSVVRTMKAMAASNIGQYEMAVSSLEEYYRTIVLGVIAYFRQEGSNKIIEERSNDKKVLCVIVFGSDQGLVGQFNEVVADFTIHSLKTMTGRKEIWAVGGRVHSRMREAGLSTTELFSVPNSVNAITPLVREILIKSEEREGGNEFYIFHNRSKSGGGYEPILQRWLPLDKKWHHDLSELDWPTKSLPEVIGNKSQTLSALIHEYLFVSLFRSCAQSLASENASRLEAMQRAEKNIDDLVEDLHSKFHRLRQGSIDEELFDVISGFEALKPGKK
jgi:F-type H+-transporting ATPase subunit gamma